MGWELGELKLLLSTLGEGVGGRGISVLG